MRASRREPPRQRRRRAAGEPAAAATDGRARPQAARGAATRETMARIGVAVPWIVFAIVIVVGRRDPVRARDDRLRDDRAGRVLPHDAPLPAAAAGRLRRRRRHWSSPPTTAASSRSSSCSAATFPVMFLFAAARGRDRERHHALDRRHAARRSSGSASRSPTPCSCASCPLHGGALLIDVLVGDLPHRHRRLRGRPPVRPPPARAEHLAEQDARGPRLRLRRRHAGLLVRRPLPGLAARASTR